MLSNGKELIPIREEFRMLQNYLLIQRYRYATILDFQIEAEPEAENYIIPKMTLQPLVENSLYHGIKEKHLLELSRLSPEYGLTILLYVFVITE